MEVFKEFLNQQFPLTESVWTELSQQIRKKTYKKGEVLLKGGSVCEHSFFVSNGLLRMYSLDENGKEHLIQFSPENWFLADRSSLYFKSPSDYYIDAIEDTEVVLLPANFNCTLAGVLPQLAHLNELLLHNHIRQLQQRINLLISANAQTRYLAFVNQFPNLLLRVPQWMIASYLGITPEGLSRVRKELAYQNQTKK